MVGLSLVCACYPVWLLCTFPLVGVCYSDAFAGPLLTPYVPRDLLPLPYSNRNSLSLLDIAVAAFEAEPTVALHLKTSNAIGNLDQCSS
jgi:hypothetical protein